MIYHLDLSFINFIYFYKIYKRKKWIVLIVNKNYLKLKNFVSKLIKNLFNKILLI